MNAPGDKDREQRLVSDQVSRRLCASKNASLRVGAAPARIQEAPDRAIMSNVGSRSRLRGDIRMLAVRWRWFSMSARVIYRSFAFPAAVLHHSFSRSGADTFFGLARVRGRSA